jgi:GNAT superfamily N-acetyltransferase
MRMADLDVLVGEWNMTVPVRCLRPSSSRWRATPSYNRVDVRGVDRLAAAMTTLRFVRVEGEIAADDWRDVHNAIISAAPLTLAEVVARSLRRVLEVVYADDVLVGCSTVRPPEDGDPVTVIARVLPEHRRQGYGEQLYIRALEHGRALTSGPIQTVVLGSNEDGLGFALAHGFVEVDRHLEDGDTIPFITLRLP